MTTKDYIAPCELKNMTERQQIIDYLVTVDLLFEDVLGEYMEYTPLADIEAEADLKLSIKYAIENGIDLNDKQSEYLREQTNSMIRTVESMVERWKGEDDDDKKALDIYNQTNFWNCD